LPTYAFATQPPHVQVVIGGAMAAMITAAIRTGGNPAAGNRVDSHTDRFALRRLLSRRRPARPQDRSHFLLVGPVPARTACRLLTRWTFGQPEGDRATTTQAESIRLLLKEYEHRGVGWLWQVDSRIASSTSRRG
jgi:hypothetical protein